MNGMPTPELFQQSLKAAGDARIDEARVQEASVKPATWPFVSGRSWPQLTTALRTCSEANSSFENWDLAAMSSGVKVSSSPGR